MEQNAHGREQNEKYLDEKEFARSLRERERKRERNDEIIEEVRLFYLSYSADICFPI